MANIITGVRILCGIALLFFPVFSPSFYALYIAAGVSDMTDGAVARKTGTVSSFGSKLDTAADLVLAAVCLIKLVPVLGIPPWLYIWIAAVALIKVVNIISGYVLRKEFAAVHTVMNKVTGMLLFILPLTSALIDLRYSGALVCAAATFAAIQEGHYIRTGRSGADTAGLPCRRKQDPVPVRQAPDNGEYLEKHAEK
ncbi:MAG: CDP-alcohol phosphatidyltransferase family protein [Clostridia bacterium]|nr:CDP-alcohol phosphatidyltransferase family protein [Clostridia bacterium]